MSKRTIFLICLVLLLPAIIFAGGKQEKETALKKMTVEQWEEWAQVGDYRTAEDDWTAIEAAAKEEGEVVIYCNSSRVYDFARTFYNKYGIKAVPYDISTGNLFEKVMREQDAGIFNVDVILTSDTVTLYKEFLPDRRVYKWTPYEIEAKFNKYASGEDLGIQRLGGKVIAYNSEVYSESPVDSWWDLTRPEWKGKVVMKDPLLGGSEIRFLATFVQYSDIMADLYREEFGENIVLNGTENAGYEFLKRLLENDVILMSGGSPVAAAVGGKGQADPPLGIVSPSKMREREIENLDFEIAWDIKPVATFLSKSAISIARFSKHPNAAKLMIRWSHGNDQGGMGYAPYYTYGTWSPLTTVPEAEGQPSLDGLEYWEEDVNWLYNNIIKIRDFMIQIL